MRKGGRSEEIKRRGGEGIELQEENRNKDKRERSSRYYKGWGAEEENMGN